MIGSGHSMWRRKKDTSRGSRLELFAPQIGANVAGASGSCRFSAFAACNQRQWGQRRVKSFVVADDMDDTHCPLDSACYLCHPHSGVSRFGEWRPSTQNRRSARFRSLQFVYVRICCHVVVGGVNGKGYGPCRIKCSRHAILRVRLKDFM